MKRIVLWLAFLLPALAHAQNEDSLAARIYRHTHAGEFEQALVKANQLISINPKKALSYSLRAGVYVASGDGRLAMDDLDAAIKLDAKEPLYLIQKASLHNLALMSDEAIDDANAGLAIATTDTARLALYNERGLAKSRKGDFQGAVEDYELVLKLDPANSFAYRNRALVSLAQKKTAEACEDLIHAEKLGFSRQYGDEVKKLLEANCR